MSKKMKSEKKDRCRILANLRPQASGLWPHKLLLLLATLSVACMANPCSAADTRGEVLLEESSITLGDIFSNAGDKATFVVGEAPVPGKSVTYDASALMRIAKAADFEWKPSSNYERVTLTRASEAVTASMIKDLVAQELQRAGLTNEMDIALDNRLLEVNRPKGTALNYRLTDFQHDPIRHRFTSTLVVDANASAKADVIPVTGRAIPMVRLAKLTHAVKAGEALGDSDVEWFSLPQDKTGADAVTDVSALKDMETRRNMETGAVLRRHDMRAARLVTKGSLVTMQVQTPFMNISTQGRAINDGAMGETVRVLNTQSNRTVDATVIGTGKVSVVSPPTPTHVAVSDTKNDVATGGTP
jgi:flagella basal body P-ring formation protein FlgA